MIPITTQEIRAALAQPMNTYHRLLLEWAVERLERLDALFPGGIDLPAERWEDKRAREETADLQAGIIEEPNTNPLPVDPFFVG